MPFTDAQKRLFHAAAESPSVAREHGMSQAEARRLAAEADRLAGEGKEKKASRAARVFLRILRTGLLARAQKTSR